MKSLFGGLRDVAVSLTEVIETHSPTVKTKLSQMGRDAQTHAAAAQQVVEGKTKEAMDLGLKVLANERTQGMISSVTDELKIFKSKLTKASPTAPTHVDEGVSKQPLNEEQTKLSQAITKLQARDKVGLSAEVLSTAGGAAAGVAVAGTVASAAGAATLLGSTSLASLFGGVFVAATPFGWVIGSAVLAGAAGYGISRMVRSGSNQDRTRTEIIERLSKRLEVLKEDSKARVSVIELGQLVAVCLATNLITEEQGRRMVDLVEKGVLKPELAIQRLKSLALAEGVIKSPPPDHLPLAP